MLRQIALAHSRMAQVGQAIGWIRSHFAEPLRIDDVAQRANMSASTFHRHFKAVTAMSPLQYQKQIRLQEARRLLLAGQADAASIGFTVGYESPSQFSREYARMYGQPPLRDAVRLRGLGPLVAV
jgi:AraC-like DNA-binding protein